MAGQDGKSIFSGIILLIFAVMLLLSMCNNSDSDEGYDETDARIFAEDAIRDVLKAPSTAEFSGLTETEVINEGNDVFTVRGWVDAENSFGAKLRSNYEVRLKITGEYSYELLDIEVFD